MPKLTNRKKLIKQLDILSKEVVRARDGNTCQKCNKWVEGSNRQCSHVRPVSSGNKLRWDPLNMKILCYHCHLNWWHKNPLEASEWFKERFPERDKYLKETQGLYKFTLQELEDIKTNLQKQLDESNATV